jgi:hypothetical protein
MDPNILRAIVAFGIIFFSFLFYKILGYFIKKKSNVISKEYSKSYDVCRVLSKCSDMSYNETNKEDPFYNSNRITSEKKCSGTKTNIPWRKDFKCQYDNINSISSCYDCLDPEFDDDGDVICGLRKHDMDDGIKLLPDYNTCLEMMGTTERLDKRKLFNSYGLNVKDKPKNNEKYKGLNDDWWNKHTHLFKCFTSHPEYLFSSENQDELIGFDTEEYHNYSSNNFYRLLSCSLCFEKHEDNVEAFKTCMQKEAECYQENWPDSDSVCQEGLNTLNEISSFY